MPGLLPKSLTDALSNQQERCIMCDTVVSMSECCRTIDDLDNCARFRIAENSPGGFAKLSAFLKRSGG